MIDSSHPGLGLKNRSVLIVADDLSKVVKLREILSIESYQVSHVDTGTAALHHYQRFEPDLVLLDVNLPWEDVFEVCRALKNPYSGMPATVIFITSKSDSEDMVAGLAAGGIDYLTTPFREREVLARVRVHLRNRLRLVQLHQDDIAKDRKVTITAHDLRNPATSIRALAHTLRTGKMGPMAPEQLEMLNIIYGASQSMLDLINNLLDASVLEASELVINTRPTSLHELVQEAVKLNNANAAIKRSNIVLVAEALPELMIDGPKIRQVLDNLLGNAVKFSPPGSTITVYEKFALGQCYVAIHDQGPGIPEGEHGKLFKDYGKTSVRPTGDEPSTGLGLSISQQIMLAHNGTIQVGNLPGGGAEFRISFPVSQ
jgi:two-component system, sensor histidine kinase and response regulator